MPRVKTITLAGQDYEVAQLPMKGNKEWRDRLTEPVDKIVALLQNYRDIEINTGADIAGLFLVVKDILLGGMDLLLDALFDYAPALAADRERIENEAYDDEAIAALGGVIGLAYPLDRLLTVWFPGQSATPISTNSASQNGRPGTKPKVLRKTT